MLKALVRKNLLEIFRSYYVNRKTGKLNSRKKTASLFVFFALMMLFLASMFYGLASLMAAPLAEAGLNWLYYALMGLVAIAMGVFGSVFNTYSGLYLAKDNELLIAMPIPAGTILCSRLINVFLMSLLYSGVVWIPAAVCGMLHTGVTPGRVLFGLLLIPGIALFVTVLTCFLGWIVALIARRLKNQSLLTVLITLILLGAYYAVCFRLKELVDAIIGNIGRISRIVQDRLGLIYRLGQAADGDGLSMLIFSAVTLLLCAVCFVIMSRTFVRMCTGGASSSHAVYKEKTVKARSVKSALLIRELQRFAASPTYMLNCGLGLVILPVLAVFALFRQAELAQAVTLLRMLAPDMVCLLPLAVPLSICIIVSVNIVSTPSVSLEGKHLWILQTLPVSTQDILEAKVRLHVLLNAVSSLLSAVLLCVCLGIDGATAGMILLTVGAFVRLTAIAGMLIGVFRPNLTWTSEHVVIKQSLNTLFSWLAGLLVTVLLAAGGYLLRNLVPMWGYLAGFTLLETAAALGLNRLLMTRGAEAFDQLS